MSEKKKDLVLDLDDFFSEYPSCSFDIGGMGHYIIIKPENKEKAIHEMVEQYRQELEENFTEEEEE